MSWMQRVTRSLHLGVLSAALLAAGCGDDDTPAPTDAGSQEVDAGTQSLPDAGFEPSFEWGPCVVDAQCPGEDGICRRAADGFPFPGGSCSRRCDPADPDFSCDRGEGLRHVCEPHPSMAGVGVCNAQCLNSQDCGQDQICLLARGASVGICSPACNATNGCGEGSECNPWNGRCGAPGSAPTTGALTGQPCNAPTDCRSGLCQTGDGWTAGYCISPCALPVGYNSNTFFAGEALPTGECPDNAICFPSGDLSRGSAGSCLTQCDADGDCRSGYTCRKTFNAPRPSGFPPAPQTYSNGVCLPTN